MSNDDGLSPGGALDCSAKTGDEGTARLKFEAGKITKESQLA